MKKIDPYRKLGEELAAFAVKKEHMQDSKFYKLAFLNWYANALYGSGQNSVDTLASYYLANDAGGDLPVIGRSEKLSPAASVVVDCFSAVSLAYDDIHYETTLHPAAPVVAAAIGLARKKKIKGEELLCAIRKGLEVECRCARAMFGTGTESSAGWYVSGIVGGIGAAAAVGYLLNLNEEQMETAFGLAASRAAGLRSSHGAMSTYLVPAFAAEAGYTAACMAEYGITCKLDAMTGREGLIRMIAAKPDCEKALENLGTEYICEATVCKPYPYGFIAHAMIAGCIELSEYMAEKKQKLKKLYVDVSAVSAKLGGSPDPDNAFDAHTSLPYIAALIMTDKNMAYVPVEEEFEISDVIRQLEGQIEIREDRSLTNSQAVCRAVFCDGTEKIVRSDVSAGSPANKMGDDEIRQKCLRLLTAVIGISCAETLTDRILSMETMQDVSELFDKKSF